MRIALADRVLEAFDENTNLLAHFPCSIAQRVEKRPVGELHVDVMAPNPNYTFDPDVFPESAEAKELDRKLILQPGPNNPVGAVWIGLDWEREAINREGRRLLPIAPRSALLFPDTWSIVAEGTESV